MLFCIQSYQTSTMKGCRVVSEYSREIRGRQKAREIRSNRQIERQDRQEQNLEIVCRHTKARVQEALSKASSGRELELDLSYLNLQKYQNLSTLFPHLKTLQLHGNSLTAPPTANQIPSTLTYLSLGENNIESIQQLQYIDLSNIKFLKLYSNKIRKISSLRKLCMPFLEEINLQNNPVVDLGFVVQLNRNWGNNIQTRVLVNSPTNIFLKQQVEQITPKCHPTKLKLILNFQ